MARPFRRGHSVSVAVSINGRELGELEIVASWRRYNLAIPAGTLRQGINSLDLVHKPSDGGAVVLYDHFSLTPAQDAGQPAETP